MAAGPINVHMWNELQYCFVGEKAMWKTDSKQHFSTLWWDLACKHSLYTTADVPGLGVCVWKQIEEAGWLLSQQSSTEADIYLMALWQWQQSDLIPICCIRIWQPQKRRGKLGHRKTVWVIGFSWGWGCYDIWHVDYDGLHIKLQATATVVTHTQW